MLDGWETPLQWRSRSSRPRRFPAFPSSASFATLAATKIRAGGVRAWWAQWCRCSAVKCWVRAGPRPASSRSTGRRSRSTRSAADRATAAFLQGQVVLLVNTASLWRTSPASMPASKRCGAQHMDRGLVVLGVPVQRFRQPGAGLARGDQSATRGELRASPSRLARPSRPISVPTPIRSIADGGRADRPARHHRAGTSTRSLIGRDGRVIDWSTPLTGTGAKLESAVGAALAAQ